MANYQSTQDHQSNASGRAPGSNANINRMADRTNATAAVVIIALLIAAGIAYAYYSKAHNVNTRQSVTEGSATRMNNNGSTVNNPTDTGSDVPPTDTTGNATTRTNQ